MVTNSYNIISFNLVNLYYHNAKFYGYYCFEFPQKVRKTGSMPYSIELLRSSLDTVELCQPHSNAPTGRWGKAFRAMDGA